MARALEHALRIVDRFKREAGFTYVALDLGGYRRGSMNEAAPSMIAIGDVAVH
jgi:PP-loop superfamily ATP-utilizing enzyme